MIGASKLCGLALFFCLKTSNSIHERRIAVVDVQESTASSELSPPSAAASVTQFFRDKHPKSHWKWSTTDTSTLKDNVYDPTWSRVMKIYGRRGTHRKRDGADSAEDGDGHFKSRFVPRPKRIDNRKGSRSERFGWHLFKLPSPPLFDYDNHAFSISSWSQRPNDMLLVVLQQQQPSTSVSSQCACDQRGTASLRNFSSQTDRLSDSTPAAEPQLREQPSACIWAIVACCSPVNFHFRYGCFHYLACTIVFWQVEPCQLSIILAASREATRYYEQFLPTASSTPSTAGNETTTATSSGTTSTPVTPSISMTRETTTTTTTATTTEPTTQVVAATIIDDEFSTTIIGSSSQSSPTR